MIILKIAAAIALGVVGKWVVEWWLGQFENYLLAAFLTFGCFVLYAIVYDSRQARRHRAIEAQKSPERWP